MAPSACRPGQRCAVRNVLAERLGLHAGVASRMCRVPGGSNLNSVAGQSHLKRRPRTVMLSAQRRGRCQGVGLLGSGWKRT